MVRDPKTKIVVNCAGRTRSILGAQTLINFGVPNPVYALENGTQGWRLADLELEYGSSRTYPPAIDPATLPAQQAAARALMVRYAIQTVTAAQVEAWFREENRTTYVCDVRTPEEYTAGSLPGALHAPGGQLIQATDQWVGVRNARIVLADAGENVRAPVVASWLKQLGCDAYVLAGGVGSGLSVPRSSPPALPHLESIPASALQQALDDNSCIALDLRSSMAFRKAHIPRSRWSIRPRLASAMEETRKPAVIIADDPEVGRLAAVDIFELGVAQVRLLAGGISAWVRAGYRTEPSTSVPPDADCIDYLFFVHDRHAGNREAMKQYLAWETGLIAQLPAEDRALFRVELPAH
jgi:rhodanese-related sulfurtransferase